MPQSVDPARFLEYFSKKILKIAIPVILTLIIDAALTRFLEQNWGGPDFDRDMSVSIVQSSQEASIGQQILMAVSIIIGMIVVTFILVLLYYCGCLKVITVWLGVAVGLLMSLFVWLCFRNVPFLINIPADWITVVIIIANLVVTSVMAIFWRAPKIYTQVVLVTISILMALNFLALPSFTMWILLGALVIYDCVMVLCPHGLLKIIIETSEERGDKIPALIYASAVWYEEEEPKRVKIEGDSEDENEEQPLLQNQTEDMDEPIPFTQIPDLEVDAPVDQETQEGNTAEQQTAKSKTKGSKYRDEENEEGIQLGLGDFVFYGLLVTRAARVGWDVTILVIFAVITGLGLTLILLALCQRALPALPCSLLIGGLFYFIGKYTFRPFDQRIVDLKLVF